MYKGQLFNVSTCTCDIECDSTDLQHHKNRFLFDKIGKQAFISQCSVDKYPNLSMMCMHFLTANIFLKMDQD